ncbi:MAG: TonB-dependent receptor [Bacteroidota bacterium]
MLKFLLIPWLMVLSIVLYGQSQSITGKVTASDYAQGLPGVSILVKGTQNGTITDVNGEYSLQASQGDVLVFSFVGYTTMEVSVGVSNRIDVEMELNVETLQEIVVIGYGTRTKSELTTAISSLDDEVIKDKPFVTVEQAINGKAAGVQVVQSSGAPGDAINVRIRGGTSVGAGNEPLYVVDGVPVQNTEGINPADVVSIDILKDAASASIYGARAANGVVLIETKKGEKGKGSLDFSFYAGFDEVSETLPLLNSQQYLDLVNTSRQNAGLPIVQDPFNGQFNTDFQNELFDRATVQNYQLGFSKGSDDGSFYASAGYQEQEGVISPSSFERFSLRFNQNKNILDGLKVGSNIGLSRTNFNVINDNQRVNQGGVVLSALSTPPIIPVINEDGTFPTNPFQAFENPIAIVRGESRTSFSDKIIGNLFVEYDFLKNFKFKTSIGIDYTSSKEDRFVDPFITGNGRAQQGEASNSTFNELIWIWENTLNYNIDLFDGHNLDVLVGGSAQRSTFESTFLLGRGFANGIIPTARAASDPIAIDADIAEWSLVSYFLRGSYNINRKYFLTASIRADGSSRFGAGNRFGIFPSASAAWNLTNESFLQNNSFLDLLKLRYSFGITGNQEIGNFNSLATYVAGADFPINGEILPGASATRVENESLQWERTAQHNVGIDVEIWDSRLSATIEGYYKRTTDLLLNDQIPNTTGFTNALRNIGSLDNRGVEFALFADVLRDKDLSWNIGGNISLNRNEVLEIGSEPIFGGGVPDQGNVAILQEGEPIGNFFGFVSEGIDDDTGDVIFADLDNNGIIDDDDRQIIGNALPDYIWGLTNTLNYKGVELIIFFQGVQGQDVYNATRFELENQSGFTNQSTTVLDRWTPENTDGTLPRAVFGDPAGNNRASNRFVEDGSFIKLRELTIAYNLPTSILDKLSLSKAKIYAQGRNLFTITDYSGFDPEVSRDEGSTISPNIDFGTFPQVRSIIFGINLSF